MKSLYMTILLSGLLAGTAAADPAPAAPAAPAAPTAAYGTAGCGLGSIVFGAKPGIVQVFALTSNETLGSQFFGITSGTSNCGATSGGTVAAKSFIESNREAFAKDVSRGSGETIANLATLGGCADAHGVAQNLQRNFKQIFPSAKAADTEISAAALHALASDKTLACTKLG